MVADICMCNIRESHTEEEIVHSGSNSFFYIYIMNGWGIPPLEISSFRTRKRTILLLSLHIEGVQLRTI
jgi:hypothetical protein